MSYTPHEWTTDETITAARLNNIEEGIQEAAQSGGGGFDAVLKAYHANNSSGEYEFTIISGTFADLMAKCQENMPPAILVYCWNDLTGYKTATTAVAIYYIGDGYSVPFITFNCQPPTGSTFGNPSYAAISSFSFSWTAEDEVFEP